MIERTIVLIGALGTKGISCGGEVCKNNIFSKYFKEMFSGVIVYNTSIMKRSPFKLLTMFLCLYRHKDYLVFLSMASASANKVIRLINFIKLQNKVIYCVVGGQFHKDIETGKYNIKDYSRLSAIFVQSEIMKSSLHNKGLSNVFYIPNSKYVSNYPVKVNNLGVIDFVFLSQIRQEKGVELILEATKKLNDNHLKDRFSISFYGRVRPEYEEDFLLKIKSLDNVSYKGVLDLNSDQGYEELAKYDVMIFPTFWPGEGFPGVLIDAFIAGLPVIASDWNFNSSIIKDRENGWIIKPNDISDLVSVMYNVINMKRETLQNFISNSMQIREKYEIHNVLSENFMLGII